MARIEMARKRVKFSRWVLGAGVLLGLFACNLSDGIPVIGQDGNGVATQVLVPEKEYLERMTAAVSAAHDSTLPVLEAREARKSEGEWMLRTVTVGLGTSLQIGVGPVNVGALPHARLIFTNSTDPFLP